MEVSAVDTDGAIPTRTIVLRPGDRRVTLRCPVGRYCRQLRSRDAARCKVSARWTVQRASEAMPEAVQSVLKPAHYRLGRRKLAVKKFRRAYGGVFACSVNGRVVGRFNVTKTKVMTEVATTEPPPQQLLEPRRDQEAHQTSEETRLHFTATPVEVLLYERGTTVRQVCAAAGGKNPHTRWLRGYRPVAKGTGHERVHVMKDGTLVIKHAQPSDADTYRCVAQLGSEVLVAECHIHIRN